MNKYRVLTTTITTLLGLLFVTPSATAGQTWNGDRKEISGAQCQPSTGTQWGDFLVNPDGIRNISTTYRYISCTVPIDTEGTVDQADSSNATRGGGIYFYLTFDYSQVPATGTFATNCTFINRSFSSSASNTYAAVTSGRTAVLLQSISMQPSAFNGISLSAFHTYSFNCRLPSKVKLVHIFWQETTSDTDASVYVP